MKLYLARHGEYVTVDMRDILNDAGINAVNNLATFLKPLKLSVSHIFHSGKLRADQTAGLLSSAFQCELPPQARSGLNPEDDVTLFGIEMASSETDTLAVGHLPFMGRLVGYLVTGDANKEIVDFQTATMVCLEQVMQDKWVIRWVLSKDLFE